MVSAVIVRSIVSNRPIPEVRLVTCNVRSYKHGIVELDERFPYLTLGLKCDILKLLILAHNEGSPKRDFFLVFVAICDIDYRCYDHHGDNT
jgi:hypothetical protein